MTEADLPIPLPLLLAIVGLIGSVITAAITLWAKRWRTPADDREDRKLSFEADEQLLARFEKLLEERDKRIDGLVSEVKDLAKRVDDVVGENRVLIDYIYSVVRIVRDFGGIHLLDRPPKGVTIAGHPSNHEPAQEAPQ